MEERPFVGIAMIIVNDKNEILLGLRKSKLGNNTWGFPGGKLEKYESLQDCIIREVKEETGLDVKNLVFIAITNDIMEDINQHYVTVYFSTTDYSGELEIKEKDKCEEWRWFNPLELPDNLFLPTKNFVNGNFIG